MRRRCKFGIHKWSGYGKEKLVEKRPMYSDLDGTEWSCFVLVKKKERMCIECGKVRETFFREEVDE